jgi:deoxyribodipyrimidine photolyase-related protein
MSHATVIYPHQLFEHHPAITAGNLVFIVEDPLFFTQYRFHKQKLVFHRASMKAYEAYLKHEGYDVHYIESSRLSHTKDIVPMLLAHGITDVFMCDPVDTWLIRRLTAALSKAHITLTLRETPMFLTDQTQLQAFCARHENKKYIMRDFYIWQRKRLGVLLTEDQKPIGGSWSYDSENRKKLPKDVPVPNDPIPCINEFVTEGREYVAKHFSDNYGDDSMFFYPVTHKAAKVWLADFLKERLSCFGPYEDALTNRSTIVFHSVLSPLLNAGLLTPEYVLAQTLAFAQKNEVPLPSLEGFIRQIIGWREYIRLVYEQYGTAMRTRNYFGAKRTLPESFWNGSTGVEPIDTTIQTVLSHAYSHHIPRLMVMGNFMNLAGIDPDDCYRWFMELYIDAYDWVMVPNVYAMALYADGGTITTKPYISGSNYLLKMSDYKKAPWCDTWDALFWNFVGTHYELLKKENRLGFIGITYSKMTKEQKERYTAIAQNFIQQTFKS